jgi:uncharacterized protein (TIGR00255 family)
MTGFGYGEKQDDQTVVSVEIKSYNNRYLDLFVNLPPFLSPLESRMRTYLSDRISRGRIEVYVKYRVLEEDLDVHLDSKALNAYLAIIEQMKAKAGITEPVKVSDLLALEGLIKMEKSKDLDQSWALMLPVLNAAFDVYEKTKLVEGRKTRDDILAQLEVITRGTAYIASRADDLEKSIEVTIKDKIRQFTEQNYDENRILTETAILLVRYAIGEEITRLTAHTESFRKIMDEKAVSKKLDFLCQEMGREINTIGSKSPILEINQRVVDLKDALEKIREQLRNVE